MWENMKEPPHCWITARGGTS